MPREAFSKLNALYDRDVLPQVKDGVFVDRQAFLRRLVDESEEIDDKAFAEEPPGTEPAEDGGPPATGTAPTRVAALGPGRRGSRPGVRPLDAAARARTGRRSATST